MARSQHLTSSARSTVKQMLLRQLPPGVVYHNYRHTVETVNAARTIGSRTNLSAAEMEILLLAAWFHDTGFVKSAAGHERISAKIASQFLRMHRYPAKKTARVVRCIRATKMPRKPRTVLERILCDADLASLGKRSFFERNEDLRIETESRKGRRVDSFAWLRRTHQFLERVRFTSREGRTLYEKGRQANLRRLEKDLLKGVVKQSRRSP